MSTLLPKNSKKKSLDFINEIMNKKALNKLLSQIYLDFGTAKTAHLANALKNLGFRYATKAGTTISIEDLVIPEIKKELIKKAEDEIDKATNRYFRGEITEVERYTKVIDTWSETTEKLTEAVVENFDRLNPVYMMAFSGARGNVSQVSQLVGMRGLMADAQGQIIDLPIKANFKEGLNVTEYIISSYGARKGLVDTALKTADSGYLTRRLVDVAQDVIIREHDCHTSNGISLTGIGAEDKVIVELEDRLLGRTLAKDAVNEKGEIIIPANTLLSRVEVDKITNAGIREVKIRSPLTCDLEYGICQKCYGWALTSNKLVDIGEAIGIIAAQSIGEPGTQLTMRTFHTGGVFRGASRNRQIKAEVEGTVISRVNTRELRTRHGDQVEVSVKDGVIEIENKAGKVHSYSIPYNATVFPRMGDKISKGDVISEFEPGASRGDSARLTEKATKDITANLSGKVVFDGFAVDEKRDRQGNISRTTNKGGKVWVLSGEVYNLPGGSQILVKDDQKVKQDDVLAEITMVSEHGGQVKLGDELQVEEISAHGKKIKKVINGKEITIVIASIFPENADLETTKKEQLWNVQDSDEAYVIKSPLDTVVENGMVIAELVNEDYRVTSSGEVRYDGLEVDDNQVITKSGKLYFIPEELHQISKDSTLKMIESGTYVTAGTEIVKDVRARIDGIVELKEYNDIIHEAIIRPGELHKIDSVNVLKVEDGDIVDTGTEIAPGLIAKEKCMVSIISSVQLGLPDFEINDEEEFGNDEEVEISEDKIDILLRPIQEFNIEPREISIKFSSTEDELIDIVPVTQLQYRDGAKVRQFDGASLTRTSLMLQMQGYLSHLKGLVEAEGENIKIVVLENLVIRREIEDTTKGKQSTLQTEILIEDGQLIEAKTPVSKTQVLARSDGKVSLNTAIEGDVRRLLMIPSDLEVNVELKTDPSISIGELITIDQVISESGETSKIAGQVTEIEGKTIKVLGGRPYLISAGTQLQVDNKSLVQQGDLLATLIFERQKTGDIVQGLPRVEELLEGRKPKESSILAEEDGETEIEYDEDGLQRLFLVSESGRHEIKVPLDANIIVGDKQTIKQGEPLTDGALNPHDVIRLSELKVVQQYLVDEVQRVYRSQGVEIADKHIETIVRQMTKKVKIENSGDTKLLPGELLEVYNVEIENAEAAKTGGAPATYYSVLLGITKASLNTESFISAASFQETTRVLTEAAVEGKKDALRGLKENVIIGRLIPAGTGFYHLNNASEEKEAERKRNFSRTKARKPSAILEEIEGLFGTPDFSLEE